MTSMRTHLDGVITMDERGRIEFINPAAEGIFGYSASDVVGRNVTMLMTSDDAEHHDGYLRNYLRTGKAKIIGYGREVVDARLEAGHARLRAILETAVDGVITMDERGRIEFINPAAEGIFGYSASDVVGRNVTMLMTSDDAEHHDGYLRNYLRTGKAKIIGYGREVVGHRQDGTTIALDLAVIDVRLGDEVRFTGFLRDITDRKRAEEATRASEALHYDLYENAPRRRHHHG